MRRSVLALVVVVVALIGPPPAVGAAAVTVRDVMPRAGEVVDAGAVMVTVTGSGDRSAELWIDGQLTDGVPVDDPTTTGAWRITTTVALNARDHIGEIRVGGGTVHGWRFTVSEHGLLRREASSATALAADLASDQFTDRMADGAVLVRADDAADALSGAALAAGLDLPLLLTATESLPAPTLAALNDLVIPGGSVHLLGGEAAIGAVVADDLAARGFDVRRHGGVDRYATAARASSALPPSTTAFLASGTSFADALAASPAAAAVGAPILLTAAEGLPAVTEDALIDRGVTDVVAVGGTAVITDVVLGDLRDLGLRVRRVAGPDRAATSAALAAESRGPAGEGGVAVASSEDPLRALVAARDAAASGRPLLLSDAGRLSDSVRRAAAAAGPGNVVLYGPDDVIPDGIGRDLRASLASGPAGLRDRSPVPGGTVTAGPVEVSLAAEQDVDPARSVITAVMGDSALPVTVDATAPADVLTVTVDLAGAAAGEGAAGEVRFVALVALAGEPEGWARADWTVTVDAPDTVFATTGGVDLHLPSTDVALIGFHQSSHDGAQGMTAGDSGTAMVVMPSRGRGTHPTGAADIVANPELPITAPATGTVVRAGTYRLYCDHEDHYLVIEPDAQPGWEVKLLHFTGLSVGSGDRVEAGVTQVGSGPRVLPFRSQVDSYEEARGWPHVHVEVVDPSVPDRPGSGC